MDDVILPLLLPFPPFFCLAMAQLCHGVMSCPNSNADAWWQVEKGEGRKRRAGWIESRLCSRCSPAASPRPGVVALLNRRLVPPIGAGSRNTWNITVVDGGRAVRRIECQMKCDELKEAARFKKQSTHCTLSHFLTAAVVCQSARLTKFHLPFPLPHSHRGCSDRAPRWGKNYPSPRQQAGKLSCGDVTQACQSAGLLNPWSESTAGRSMLRLCTDMNRERGGKNKGWWMV